MAKPMQTCYRCKQSGLVWKSYTNDMGVLDYALASEDGTFHSLTCGTSPSPVAYTTAYSLDQHLNEATSISEVKSLVDAVTVKADAAMARANSLLKEFATQGQEFEAFKASAEARAQSLLSYVKETDRRWEEKLASAAPVVIKHVDGNGDVTATHDLGKQHKLFPRLVQMVRSTRGRGIVFLTGEPGSMKTSALPPLAKALGDLPYYAISMTNQTSRAELMGFLNGSGDYMATPVYRVVKDGGVLLIDEIDNGNPNGTTGMNAAATNNFVGFPNGETLLKHLDCYIIAAGNTIGAGGDEKFMGRNQLDLATRTRFRYLKWDTDWELVAWIVRTEHGTDFDRWVPKVKLLHDIVQRRKIEFVVSSRVALVGAQSMADGWDSESGVLDDMVWIHLTADERRVVEEEYVKATGPVSTVPWSELAQQQSHKALIDEVKAVANAVEAEDLSLPTDVVVKDGLTIPPPASMAKVYGAVRDAYMGMVNTNHVGRSIEAIRELRRLTNWDLTKSRDVVLVWAELGKWEAVVAAAAVKEEV